MKSGVEFSYEYHTELVYNVIMLILLSGALLSYFYLDNKKALCFFIAVLFLVFSEIVDLAYIYIEESALLGIISTGLRLFASFVLYKQAKLKYSVDSQEDHFKLMDEC